MGLVSYKKGQIVHKLGEEVQTLELVLQGRISTSFGSQSLLFSKGDLLGLSEKAGSFYTMTFVAEEDTTVYSYPYEDEESIVSLIRNNGKISPTLAIAKVRNTLNYYYSCDAYYEELSGEYNAVQNVLSEYPILSKRAGRDSIDFSSVSEFDAPELSEILKPWQLDAIEALRENEQKLMVTYSLSPAIAAGAVLELSILDQSITKSIGELMAYQSAFHQATEAFQTEMEVISVYLNSKKTDTEDAGEDNSDGMPLLENAMDTILAFTGISGNRLLEIRKFIEAYKALDNRHGTTDDERRLRKSLTDAFMEMYTKAFLRDQIDPKQTPDEVKMFLWFGFIDEELAGAKNTETMYRILHSYKPDPEGRVYSIYEWLTMVYRGIKQPSKDEFGNDFEGALREAVTHGDITEAEMAKRLKNPEDRARFEIENMFRLGNRMTFGRITTYQPFFDAENTGMSLEKIFLSHERVNAVIDRIKGIDKYLFRRERVYYDDTIGIKNLNYYVEVLPTMILFPNAGERAGLWQEIEGKRRDSSARMLLPIFMTENLDKALVSLCGEFRWEITKTEQGVHWNDLRDPSLTAEYADYIQYYRKNRDLDQQAKEKVKKQIARSAGNLRRIFTSDYVVYIYSESNGSPLLNKVSRRILFTYAPFSKKSRDKLKSIALYKESLNRFENKNGEAIHLWQNIIRKLEHQDQTVPPEFYEQVEFLES